jgi:transposase
MSERASRQRIVVGIRTAAQILLNIGDASAFETPGHLAAYAGIAPPDLRP